jgi:cell division protein FtsI/penicillin-binding protein 2
VQDAYGNRIEAFAPEAYGTTMTVDEAALLTEWMTECVTDGTGVGLLNEAYTAAGKTGTAEWEEGKKSHGWFVGFAPASAPQIVVSIIVEEGGSGSEAAVPIAKAIFDTKFR